MSYVPLLLGVCCLPQWRIADTQDVTIKQFMGMAPRTHCTGPSRRTRRRRRDRRSRGGGRELERESGRPCWHQMDRVGVR